MRPSSETVSSLNGSPTLSTPALSPLGLNSGDLRSAIAFSIAASRSGVSSRSPSGAAKTMFSTAPCSDANSDLIRSVAFCVSDPGISNSSRSEPPIVATRTTRRMTMPIQPKTTRHGCVAQARVQRASAPVERRSWAARRWAAGRAAEGASPGFRSLSGPPSCSVIVCPFCRFGFSLETGRGPGTHRSPIGWDCGSDPTCLPADGGKSGRTSRRPMKPSSSRSSLDA